jgi:NAD(P)-dependent dehydrogenase (short-subunit alcohol dehydrogenase family)
MSSACVPRLAGFGHGNGDRLPFAVNISAMFYLVKAATPHTRRGSTIINTASINSDSPNPHLLAYATTKGAIQNFTGDLAQLLADKGIRG